MASASALLARLFGAPHEPKSLSTPHVHARFRIHALGNESGATGACLLGKLPPPSACTAEWRQPGCLFAHVPFSDAIRPSLTEIGACFRCCLLGALHHSGLSRNAPFWRRVLLNESYDPWWPKHLPRTSLGAAQGVDDDASVLLGAFSAMRYADLGGTYANASLLEARGRAAPAVALFVLHGWTAKQHEQVLAKLWQTLAPRARATVFTMGDQYLPHGANAPRVDDARVAAWWAHNPSTRHPKLHAFPRGPWRTSGWAETLRAAPRPRERRRLLFCDCMKADHFGRRAKLAALRRNGFACEPDCGGGDAARSRFADGLLSSRFAASPRGGGAQNHRDWEALLAGAIPIVDHDARLDEMWAGLPVVAVTNWSDVTPQFLEAEWRRMAGQEWAAEKIYFPFWLGKLLETM